MTFRKFLKARPTEEGTEHIFEGIREDSPRAAAMLAGALMDELLKGAISYRLVELNKEDSDGLFTGNAPLATFSAKIRVSYALGIIGKRTRHDIELVREIRNGFAHTLRDLSFETPELTKMCSQFHCLKDLREYAEISARGLFSISVHRLALFLITKTGPFPEGRAGLNLQGNTQLD
jgi:hypothetical protein